MQRSVSGCCFSQPYPHTRTLRKFSFPTRRTQNHKRKAKSCKFYGLMYQRTSNLVDNTCALAKLTNQESTSPCCRKSSTDDTLISNDCA
jgi:hypothetical protein